MKEAIDGTLSLYGASKEVFETDHEHHTENHTEHHTEHHSEHHTKNHT